MVFAKFKIKLLMDFKIFVIGAGAVGLAIAKNCLKLTSSLAIVDKNRSFGLETSSRNSEVIHSGIYYPKGTLKSQLCIRGNKLMYDYCRENKINFKKCGKIIVGKGLEDLSYLNKLKKNAKELSIEYNFLNHHEIRNRYPLVDAEYAIDVISSGIVDSHGFMNSLYNDLISHDVNIAFKTEVVALKKIKNGYEIMLKNPDNSTTTISSNILINSSGLFSNIISKMLGIFNKSEIIQFWKGTYFSLVSEKAIGLKKLIYPIPNKNLYGLGIHTTVNLDGRTMLGPDSEYLGNEMNFNYQVNSEKKDLFYEASKRYLPFLKIEDLEPSFSGVRPKLQKPGDGFKDFVINNEVKWGCPNYINLVGIESPGLTSSLAIGEFVTEIIL